MRSFQCYARVLCCLSIILAGSFISSAIAQKVPPVFSAPTSTPTAKADEVTLITLHLKKVPLRVAVEKLAKQANIKLEPFAKEIQAQINQSVTVDIDKQPFHSAIQALLKPSKLGLFSNGWNKQPTWRLASTDQFNGPSVQSEGFLVVANGIGVESNVVASIYFGGKSSREVSQSALITMNLFADPRLRIIGERREVEVEQAIDENGHSFIFDNSGEADYIFLPGSFLIFATPLDLPMNYGKRLTKFKGYLHPIQLKKSIFWTVPNIMNLKKAEKTVLVNGVKSRFVVGKAKKANGQYQIQITVSYDQSRVDIPFQTDALQFARLLDANGQPFSSCGYGTHDDTKNIVTDILFDQQNPDRKTTGEPKKLVLEIPTDFVELRVPFEFANLPLP